MLTSQVIFIKHLKGDPESVSGNHLHGFFFKEILGTQQSELASLLHGSKSEKPFSISYLYTYQNMYWFRITSWDERIPQAIFSYFNINKEIQFNRCVFQLIKTTTDPDDIFWANRQSFQEFIEGYSYELDRFRIIHHSATSFKSGNAHIPLPVPDLLIKSIYRKLPSPLKEYAQVITDEELIDAIRLKGHKIYSIYNKKTYGSIASFQGETRWQIDKRASSVTCQTMCLILNFAFYSGIGVKTTQGMGMCRIV
ncbi:CRISPR-associated protein Cas6 [Candidatus Magnetomorum sp. HK-1]|nr:CRISPR-associated protein Cas6 [Candidatus Magnetomorum sp. HK-1]